MSSSSCRNLLIDLNNPPTWTHFFPDFLSNKLSVELLEEARDDVFKCVCLLLLLLLQLTGKACLQLATGHHLKPSETVIQMAPVGFDKSIVKRSPDIEGYLLNKIEIS